MRVRDCALVAILAGVSNILGVPAYAFDLTGHWQGKWSCKGFSAPFMDHGKLVNKFASANATSTLAITQSGADFGAEIDGTFRYNSVGMNDAKDDHKGEAIVLGCLDANTLPTNGTEIVRAQVKTKAGTFKATFSGISVFGENFGGSFPEVETCKYSYKRIDTTDPSIGACP